MGRMSDALAEMNFWLTGMVCVDAARVARARRVRTGAVGEVELDVIDGFQRPRLTIDAYPCCCSSRIWGFVSVQANMIDCGTHADR